MLAERPEAISGKPGIVAPMTPPPENSSRASIQTEGALNARCGSFASNEALPAVRVGAAAHTLEAPVRPFRVRNENQVFAVVSPVSGAVPLSADAPTYGNANPSLGSNGIRSCRRSSETAPATRARSASLSAWPARSIA